MAAGTGVAMAADEGPGVGAYAYGGGCCGGRSGVPAYDGGLAAGQDTKSLERPKKEK